MPRRRVHGLLVRELGDELVVYDEQSRVAHHLPAETAAAWLGLDRGLQPRPAVLNALRSRGLLTGDGVSRRTVLRAGVVGAGAAMATPLIETIVAPSAAASCSVPATTTSIAQASFDAASAGITDDPTTPDTVNIANLGNRSTPDGFTSPFGWVFNLRGNTPAYSLNWNKLNGTSRRFIDAYSDLGYQNYIGYAKTTDTVISLVPDGYHSVGIRYERMCGGASRSYKATIVLTNTTSSALTLGIYNGTLAGTMSTGQTVNTTGSTATFPANATFTGTATGTLSGSPTSTPPGTTSYFDVYVWGPQNNNQGVLYPVTVTTYTVTE